MISIPRTPVCYCRFSVNFIFIVLITCIQNFKSQGDIRHRSLDFICLFLLGHLLVRWLGGFLPPTAAKFRLVWKIPNLLIEISRKIYATYFFILIIIHILHISWFSLRLKRVGSVSSRSELDSFLYIWYHTVRTQNGVSPCAQSIESWPLNKLDA